MGEYRSDGKYLHYIRDETSRVIGFNYGSSSTASGGRYYFVFNAQGDVIQVVNDSGTVMANYAYDTWGNITSATNGSGGALSPSSVGALNPFRYRGYYYDTETGLYYLQSRYYDPVVGRFINADNSITYSDGNILSCNLYVYCNNNLVSLSVSSAPAAKSTTAVNQSTKTEFYIPKKLPAIDLSLCIQL